MRLSELFEAGADLPETVVRVDRDGDVLIYRDGPPKGDDLKGPQRTSRARPCRRGVRGTLLPEGVEVGRCVSGILV